MEYLIAVFVIAVGLSLLEKAFPRYRQKTFRTGWGTDVLHFIVNRFLVDLGVILLAIPLYLLLGWTLNSPFQVAVAAQPGWLQFAEAWLVAELAFYWIHRAAHTVPRLWSFHVIHHSSPQLDWLAALRFHPVDMILARVGVGLPLVLLGFSERTFGAYLALSALTPIFVHANVRFKHPRLFWLLLGSPEYHAWHHARDPAIHNKNFGHPFMDYLFGTFHLPADQTPDGFGVAHPVPVSYWTHLTGPLRKDWPPPEERARAYW